MELELILLEHLEGASVRLGDELLDRSINALRRTGCARERGVLVEVGVLHGAERHHAELLGHAESRDHIAGKLGRLLDIVCGTGGHLAEDKLLGGTPTAVDGKFIKDLLLRGEKPLVLLNLHGIAECTACTSTMVILVTGADPF